MTRDQICIALILAASVAPAVFAQTALGKFFQAYAFSVTDQGFPHSLYRALVLT